MMDREKKDELPKMQVGFINFICMPLYEVRFYKIHCNCFQECFVPKTSVSFVSLLFGSRKTQNEELCGADTSENF